MFLSFPVSVPFCYPGCTAVLSPTSCCKLFRIIQSLSVIKMKLVSPGGDACLGLLGGCTLDQKVAGSNPRICRMISLFDWPTVLSAVHMSGYVSPT